MMMKFRGMDLHIKQLTKIPEFLKKYDCMTYNQMEQDFAEAGFVINEMKWSEIIDLLWSEPDLSMTATSVIERVFTIIQLNHDYCIENPYTGKHRNKIGFYHRLVRRREPSREPHEYECPADYSFQEAEANLECILSELTTCRNPYKNVVFDTLFI